MLKTFLLLCVGIASLLVACTNGSENEVNIYTKDTMINVLMDIHLAEARIEATGYRNIDTARGGL